MVTLFAKALRHDGFSMPFNVSFNSFNAKNSKMCDWLSDV